MVKKESGLVQDWRVRQSTSNGPVALVDIATTRGGATITPTAISAATGDPLASTVVIASGVNDVSVKNGYLNILSNNGKQQAIEIVDDEVLGIKNISTNDGELIIGYQDGSSKKINPPTFTGVGGITKDDDNLIVTYASGQEKEIDIVSAVRGLSQVANKLIVSLGDKNKEIPIYTSTVSVIPDEATDLVSAITLLNAIRAIALSNQLIRDN